MISRHDLVRAQILRRSLDAYRPSKSVLFTDVLVSINPVPVDVWVAPSSVLLLAVLLLALAASHKHRSQKHQPQNP